MLMRPVSSVAHIVHGAGVHGPAKQRKHVSFKSSVAAERVPLTALATDGLRPPKM